ncbi:MAG: hypothetical protein ABS873_06625, partial [Alkalibacterium sp.]
MNKPLNEKEQLMQELIEDHDKNLNNQILKITSIYIALSLGWNLIFQWFNLPFSRADLNMLTIIFVVLGLIYVTFRYTSASIKLNT